MQEESKRETARASFVHSKLVLVHRRTIAGRNRKLAVATLESGDRASRNHRALVLLGALRRKNKESDNNAKDEPEPPRNAIRGLGLQNRAGLDRGLENRHDHRQNILDFIRDRLLRRRQRLLQTKRFFAEIVLDRRTLHGQVRELRTAANRGLPLLLQERVGLEKTLVKGNIIRNLHRVQGFHLLGIPPDRRPHMKISVQLFFL